MIIPSADRLEDKIPNKYALVIAAAKRARQLKEGHPPLARVPSKNPLTIALEELAEGLVIPLSPEIEGPAEAAPKAVSPRVVEKDAIDLAAALAAAEAELAVSDEELEEEETLEEEEGEEGIEAAADEEESEALIGDGDDADDEAEADPLDALDLSDDEE